MFRKKIIASFALFVVLVGLWSCSSHPYKNRSTDYTKVSVKNYDLSGVELAEDSMPITGKTFIANSDKYFVAPRPQPLALNKKTSNVEIRTTADRKWLWINADLGSVWPKLYNFIERENLNILNVNPRKGEIVTATKYKNLSFSLRQGVVDNTSELYLNAKQTTEDNTTNFYRDKLKDFLQSDKQNSVSLVGANLNTNKSSTISTDSYPTLTIDFSLDRSILELDEILTRALTSAEKKLQDKNFSKHEFYIHYVPQSVKPAKEATDNSVYDYTLKVSGNSIRTQAKVYTRELKPINTDIAEEILRFIQRQLQ